MPKLIYSSFTHPGSSWCQEHVPAAAYTAGHVLIHNLLPVAPMVSNVKRFIKSNMSMELAGFDDSRIRKRILALRCTCTHAAHSIKLYA
eukprot:2012762-Amphidinium_carterae.2